MIAATCGIVSIWSVRKSADQMVLTIKWLVTTWCSADGTGGLLKILIEVLSLCHIEMNERYFLPFQMTLVAINITGISILMAQMSQSTNMTKSMMPMFIDILLNALEVVFILTGQAVKRFIDDWEREILESQLYNSIIDSFRSDQTSSEEDGGRLKEFRNMAR